MENTKTRSQLIAADISALLRSRNPLLWIVTREEARTERYICEAALSAGYVPRIWDCAQGVTELSGEISQYGSLDAGETLKTISDRAGNTRGNTDRCCWILRDIAPWLVGAMWATNCRALRNLARALPGVPNDSAQAIVVLSTTSEVPVELSGHATVINWPMPDRAEIADILDNLIESQSDKVKDAIKLVNGERESAIDAALGLSGEESAACYSKSIVQYRKIVPAAINQEKRRVIAKSRILEWIDPLSGGLDSVGGLDAMKAWLISRKLAYTPKARAYGLPAPKGMLLVGVQGCGKTLTAKAIATAWNIPLLKLDLGAAKSKYVGDSENNIREGIAIIEAVGRCVVLLDEIEKTLAGATQGAADGGVSADILGTVLSWLQDRNSEAFIVATSNDVSALPPELLRKGRFDELWFVDLPNNVERSEIIKSALRAHNRGNLEIDFNEVSSATNGFIGAEIAALVPDSLFVAYADNAREITTTDLVNAASVIVPLSKTMAPKIEALRSWSIGRARNATSISDTVTRKPMSRALDL